MMDNESKKQEFQSAAALYAFGALSYHEAKAFEIELQEAEESLKTEAFAFTEVASHLSASVSTSSPSDEVRETLLARIAGDQKHLLRQSQIEPNTSIVVDDFNQSLLNLIRSFSGENSAIYFCAGGLRQSIFGVSAFQHCRYASRAKRCIVGGLITEHRRRFRIRSIRRDGFHRRRSFARFIIRAALKIHFRDFV